MKVLVLNPTETETPQNIAKLVNTQAKKAGIQLCLCLSNIKNLSKQEIDIPLFCMGSHNLKDGEVTEINIGNHCVKISAGEIDQKVDILVSKYWPRRIAIEQQQTQFSSPDLDKVLETPPRYWFTSGDEKNSLFFERQAFQIDDVICRFISLAKKSQGRWYYAFNLPYEDDISLITTLKLPGLALKRKAENSNNDGIKRLHSITPMECFLCPVNPKFESHMVIDKSPDAFMAITKGPLGLDNGKGFIGHGMIVPIYHSPTLPTPLRESSFYTQYKEYESKLVKMFMSPESNVKNTNSFSLLFWHIRNKDQVHGHIQFLPILKSQGRDLENVIKKQIDFDERISKKKGLKKPKLEVIVFKQSDELADFWKTVDTKSYIYFGLHTNKEVKRFVLTLEDDLPFDNQFPRKVVAVLINQKNKINWKNCLRGDDFEKTECDTFKEHYKLI